MAEAWQGVFTACSHCFGGFQPIFGSAVITSSQLGMELEIKLLEVLFWFHHSPGSDDGHNWGHKRSGRPRPEGVQLQHPHQAFPVLLPRGKPGWQQGQTRSTVCPVQQEPPLPLCLSPLHLALLPARSGFMTSRSMSTALMMFWCWAPMASGMSPMTRRWLVW